MADWQRQRILIWGKTRPELSKKHREIVCTGGVFADTLRLVRLYPIPLRFMDDEKVFRKYQWIEAFVMRNDERDARPESFKIRPDDIKVLEAIDTQEGTWEVRSRYVLTADNVFRSVEALKEREDQDKTSLGIVKPAKVTRIFSEVVGASEFARFYADYEAALAQLELTLDEAERRDVKPLKPSDYRFGYEFSCDDGRCKGHRMRILDWEIDALYFNMKARHGKSEAVKKVEQALTTYAGNRHELRFFLGNIASHPKNFTIVGLWYPRRADQGTLFGVTPSAQ